MTESSENYFFCLSNTFESTTKGKQFKKQLVSFIDGQTINKKKKWDVLH